jgi:hypothetical protein
VACNRIRFEFSDSGKHHLPCWNISPVLIKVLHDRIRVFLPKNVAFNIVVDLYAQKKSL